MAFKELDSLDRDMTNRKPHRIAEILSRLDDDDREVVERALQDHRRVSARQLATFLSSHGHVVSAGTIQNWRHAHGATGG